MSITRRQSNQNKQACQHKSASSGQKSMRGVPQLYDERKVGVKVCLTPKCVRVLDHLAQLDGYSRSEFIERLARGIAHASDDPVVEKIMYGNEPKPR
ncbi:hypothetical protein ACQ4N7_30215 [Nodosilinea sp. AN01ver1]|uniref:hypothetical protein n=1 Tax=Nodosilinea sp. AN01ver1 TaxID=3423362 RepID=UPI003D32318C